MAIARHRNTTALHNSFILPFGREGGKIDTVPSLCIVQELVQGCSLADILRNFFISATSGAQIGPFSELQLSAILFQTLEALQYLHTRCRIVHRDIKAANLMLSFPTGEIKLCDFGTSGKLERLGGSRFTVVGTPGWMAPEMVSQIRMLSVLGDDHSSASPVFSPNTGHASPSDIWSLGVTVIEMLQARPPQQDPLFTSLINAMSQSKSSLFGDKREEGKPPSEPSFRNDRLDKATSFELRDFIACCLRRNPNERPTARQLSRHPFLQRAAENGGEKSRMILKELACSLPPELKEKANKLKSLKGIAMKEQRSKLGGLESEGQQLKPSIREVYASSGSRKKATKLHRSSQSPGSQEDQEAEQFTIMMARYLNEAKPSRSWSYGQPAVAERLRNATTSEAAMSWCRDAPPEDIPFSGPQRTTGPVSMLRSIVQPAVADTAGMLQLITSRNALAKQLGGPNSTIPDPNYEAHSAVLNNFLQKMQQANSLFQRLTLGAESEKDPLKTDFSGLLSSYLVSLLLHNEHDVKEAKTAMKRLDALQHGGICSPTTNSKSPMHWQQLCHMPDVITNDGKQYVDPAAFLFNQWLDDEIRRRYEAVN